MSDKLEVWAIVDKRDNEVAWTAINGDYKPHIYITEDVCKEKVAGWKPYDKQYEVLPYTLTPGHEEVEVVVKNCSTCSFEGMKDCRENRGPGACSWNGYFGWQPREEASDGKTS